MICFVQLKVGTEYDSFEFFQGKIIEDVFNIYEGDTFIAFNKINKENVIIDKDKILGDILITKLQKVGE